MAASRLGGKRILVTGGTGFLGKHLVTALEKIGAEVTAIGSKHLDLTEDISNSGVLAKRFDLIYHLAAKVAGISDNRLYPFEYLAKNALMATHIVNYALINHIPIVAAGSVCVYSNTATLPFREGEIFRDEPEKSNYGYGLSKRYLLQLLMAAYRQNSRFNYVFVNSANLYGPGDNFGKEAHVIPDLIKKVAASPQNGNKVSIMGTGMATRDFLYIGDAINAYLLAGDFLLDEGINLICNIGSGREISILDVFAIIAKCFGYSPYVSAGGGIDGQPRRLVGIDTARHVLGWRPYMSLEAGIADTIDWWKAQTHARELAQDHQEPQAD